MLSEQGLVVIDSGEPEGIIYAFNEHGEHETNDGRTLIRAAHIAIENSRPVQVFMPRRVYNIDGSHPKAAEVGIPGITKALMDAVKDAKDMDKRRCIVRAEEQKDLPATIPRLPRTMFSWPDASKPFRQDSEAA